MKNLFKRLFLSYGVDYLHEDLPMSIFMKYFGMNTSLDMDGLGVFVSTDLMETLDTVDHQARPRLIMSDIMGDRMDFVRISREHREALQKLQKFGTVSSIVHEHSLIPHFLSSFVVSDSGIFCTITLTAQTLFALMKYGEDLKEFRDAYLDPVNPWYGGTFYTETQGGSDLGSNQTSARKSGDRYILNGDRKYFASNVGIADGAIVTARIEGSRPGPRGISAFFVPYLLEDGKLNFTIRRLKDKLGTNAVPTGEVEFHNTEAHLLGHPSTGIYVATEILNISRIDDALTAAGISRKALWETYLYSGIREAFGKRLRDHPLYKMDLARMSADVEAALILSLFSAKVYNEVSMENYPYDSRYHMARMLCSMAKNQASKVAIDVTGYCMEMMGGKGFLEEYPIARFHRDAMVTSIWEGTTNIQALEFMETVVAKGAHETLIGDMDALISSVTDDDLRNDLLLDLDKVRKDLESLLTHEGEFRCKDVMQRISTFTASVLLFDAWKRSGSAYLSHISNTYHRIRVHGKDVSVDEAQGIVSAMSWMERRCSGSDMYFRQ